MAYDLLIKNGTVVDGTGAPAFRADVAISQGQIAEIGKIRDGADQGDRRRGFDRGARLR